MNCGSWFSLNTAVKKKDIWSHVKEWGEYSLAVFFFFLNNESYRWTTFSTSWNYKLYMSFKYFVVLDLNFKTCVPRTQITGNFHIFYDKLSTVLKKNIPLIINSWNQHSDVDAALICCCKARAKQKSEAVDLLVHLRSCPHLRSCALSSDWKNEVADTSIGNYFPSKGA